MPLRAFGLVLILVALGGPAFAGNGDGNNGNGKGNGGNGGDKGGKGGGTVTAPEIDLGVLPSALMLLTGGTLVLTDRIRKK